MHACKEAGCMHMGRRDACMQGQFDLLRLEEVIEARLVDELAGLCCRTPT